VTEETAPRRTFLFLGMTPFIRVVMIFALASTAFLCTCIVTAEIGEARAYRRYSEVERQMAALLRVGTPKQEILQWLAAHGLEYEDRGAPSIFVPEVTVMLAEWTAGFPQELHIGLDFGPDRRLRLWRPWQQGGP
jgi:hypothetical protein